MNLSSHAFVIISSQNPFGIVFAKNSDRPPGEVQELIYEPAKESNGVDNTKCTYISVPAVNKTHGVILSKPAWSWGCEMGANDQGVVGANVPLLTKSESLDEPALIGIDLLRLALERSNTAEAAVDTIGSLLAEFPQGGPCAENDSHSYSSAFLFADQQCAWIMETSGQEWVAKKITDGVRAVTNHLSIGSDYDKSSSNLETAAKSKGFWNGEGTLSWQDAFSDGSSDTKRSGEKALNNLFSSKQQIGVNDLTQIMRDSENRICKTASDAFPTAGSQISVLPKSGPCCHWFTATPDPALSVYKPFIFTPNVRVSALTKSPPEGDRQHPLYALHFKAAAGGDNKVITLLQNMETECLNEVESFILSYQPNQSLAEVDDLLKDIVEAEVKFYK